MLLGAISSFADETPRGDVVAGYSFMHFGGMRSTSEPPAAMSRMIFTHIIRCFLCIFSELLQFATAHRPCLMAGKQRYRSRLSFLSPLLAAGCERAPFAPDEK
jgi:hypothetical protein